MQTKVYNQMGQETGTVELAEAVFGRPANIDLVHQVRVGMLANQRRPVAHAKDRSEVRGGGRQPWRQKGTGRARHGSRRSPIWKGGGVAHGPSKEKKYSQKINTVMAHQALRMALSSKFKRGQVRILNDLSLPTAKTKDFIKIWKDLAAAWKFTSALLVLDKAEAGLIKAAANVPRLKVVWISQLNLLDILRFNGVVFTEKAVKFLNK